MSKPITAFDKTLDALKLAYAHIGWCWDKIEDNTLLRREGSGNILLHIEQAITDAERVNRWAADYEKTEGYSDE